jgi:hypothetical protein
MVEMAPVGRGDRLQTAYASSVWGDALIAFNLLSPSEQSCIDSALNDLEWCPWPEGALNLRDGRVLGVRECGFWIVYERDDLKRSLDVWAILR